MWSERRFVELFEIEHPIVLAPMAGLGTVDLAAAVSNAGGLGSIGCAIMPPELVAKSFAELRRLTTKPIKGAAAASTLPKAFLAAACVAILFWALFNERLIAAPGLEWLP